MIIRENHITVEKTARYFSNKPNNKKLKNFWFVLHGYGQLASDFINQFEFLDKDETLIVAPEGLSKFYSRSLLGASWMTKEDRHYEIEDYLNYLNRLITQLIIDYDLSEANSNLLGFSQGVHTAVRLFTNSEFKFNKLMLCSSDFPEDTDFIKLKNKLKKSDMYYINGNSDRIITSKSLEESKKLLQSKEINFNELLFEGGHVIDKDSLNLVFGNSDLGIGV
ncbi:MAG: hypothetical protein ABIY50_08770 [Ignavibacteria bacterium]